MGVLDIQIGGNHYKDLEIQPIEFIQKNNLDFLQGSIIKYITRHKNKNGAEDIQKAIHVCKLILEMQYGIKENIAEKISCVNPSPFATFNEKLIR